MNSKRHPKAALHKKILLLILSQLALLAVALAVFSLPQGVIPPAKATESPALEGTNALQSLAPQQLLPLPSDFELFPAPDLPENLEEVEAPAAILWEQGAEADLSVPEPEPEPNVEAAAAKEVLPVPAGPARATAPAPAETLAEEGPPATALASKIDSVLRRSSLKKGFWGLDVYSVSDRETLYSHNSDKHFSPASNAKVFTTAAALDRLGADFRFKTRVAYEGRLREDGILEGDLILFGQGDPDLAAGLEKKAGTYTHLDTMALKVKESGIREIEGDVVGDDSYFWHLPYGKGWKLTDLNRTYAPPVSALSFRDNLITIQARAAGQEGQPPRVSLWPTSSMRVHVRARTSAHGTKSTLHVSREPGGSVLTVRGQLPRGVTKWSRVLPVDDPAVFTASLFRERLKKAGIKVKGEARARHYGESRPAEQATEIYTHLSVPLIRILTEINKKSHNLFAEILLRALGAEIRGEGSDFAGVQVIYDFMDELGVDRAGVELHDGSGLSRLNLITPRSETQFLAGLAERHYFPQFWETLAVASQDGTLRNRMRRTAAAKKVYGKTGTLAEVTTLGGYVRTRSGKTLAFTILLNNYSFSPSRARKAFDEICGMLAQQ